MKRLEKNLTELNGIERIWKYLDGLERTWKDLKGLERTWKDFKRSWKGLNKPGRTWKDLKGLGRTWQNLKELERMEQSTRSGKLWQKTNRRQKTELLTMPVLERHAHLKITLDLKIWSDQNSYDSKSFCIEFFVVKTFRLFFHWRTKHVWIGARPSWVRVPLPLESCVGLIDWVEGILLCSFILQAGICHIFSISKNPR